MRELFPRREWQDNRSSLNCVLTYSASIRLYCASKHAVIGFVRSMAELDTLSNIKVTAVAPG